MIIWPDVFDNKDISGREDAVLCADALCAWAIVMAGNTPPVTFGEVMGKISCKLNVLGTSDSFVQWSKDFAVAADDGVGLSL